MTDAVMDFLNTGAIPKQAPIASSAASTIAPVDSELSNDPIHDWMASGGANTPTVAQEAKPYFARVWDTAKKFQASVDNPGKWDSAVAAPIAVAENLASVVTKAPLSVMGHIIDEAAYLRTGESLPGATVAALPQELQGFDPRTPAGKNLAKLASTVVEPIGEAVKWAGDKLGLSPTGTAVVGDLAPMVIPILPARIKGAVSNTKEAIATTGRAITSMNDRFQELQRIGRGQPASTPPPVELTPQMIRGQEPIPVELQNAPPVAPTPAAADIASQQPAGGKPLGAPVPESSMPRRAEPAPALSVENASPQLKQALAGEGPALSSGAIQRHLEADSLPVPVSLTAGQATGDLARLSDEMNMRADHPDLQRRFNEQNGQMIENVNAIRERVAPDVTDTNHVDNGAALIDSYAKMNAAREAEVSANYKALADANEGNIPVDGKAFAKAVDETLGNGLVNKREFLPATVERIVQRIGESKEQMTFDDFTTLRTILAKEARKASQAGDGNASHAISLVRDQLENIPMSAGAEALKPLADTAKNSAKALFQDIESDPAWAAAINGKVTPDNFVKKFVINGAREHLATMKDNIGTDPIANQTIAASALNYLKERAGTPNDAGNFSQAGYNKALNALRPKLDSLFDPVAAQQVETLGKVARYTQEQPRGSYVNNSNTFTAAVKGTAKAAVGGALNKATYGLSGAVGEAMQKGRAKGAVQESLKPAAGVKLSDIPKKTQ